MSEPEQQELTPEQVAAAKSRAKTIEVASREPIEFIMALAAVSESLSNEQYGFYTRALISNFRTAEASDIVSRLSFAYDANEGNAYAMRNAAKHMLALQEAAKQAEVDAIAARAAEIVEPAV